MLKKVFLSSALLMLVSGFTWCPDPCPVEHCADGVSSSIIDYTISTELVNTDEIDDISSGLVLSEVTSSHSRSGVTSSHSRSLDDTTFFGFDSFSLSEEAKIRLDSEIEYLNSNEHKNENILVVGHCDERGTREYNIALGERRANSVKSYLVSHGIDSSRIRVDSMGKEALRCDTTNPVYEVVSGDKDVYHQQNRRAVLSFDSGVIDHQAIKEEESMRCEINSNKRSHKMRLGGSSIFGVGSKSLFGKRGHHKAEHHKSSHHDTNNSYTESVVWGDVCVDGDEC